MRQLALFFGGESSEYEVSLRSAAAIMRGLRPRAYELLPIGITRTGGWYLTDATPEQIENDTWFNGGARPCLLSTNKREPGIFFRTREGRLRRRIPDVLFPALHGENGEDGRIQGLFALSGIPFVGCGTAASALCMDKVLTKRLCAAAGVPVVPWIVAEGEAPAQTARRAERVLSYPLFVKPARAGSSVGAGRAADRRGLIAALERAQAVDRRVLIERFVSAREVEVAVLACGGRLEISPPGEIAPPPDGFYDYEAKYHTGAATLHDHARISRSCATRVRRYAEKVFSLLGCRGCARIDFFVGREAGEPVFLNEVNTLPGFTAVSMYPRLLCQKRSFADLLDLLIEEAAVG